VKAKRLASIFLSLALILNMFAFSPVVPVASADGAIVFSDDFETATSSNLFDPNYKSLPTDNSVSMYFKTGGTPTINEGKLVLANQRMTIGSVKQEKDTTAAPSTEKPDGYTPGGVFDLSKPYQIVINLASITGTGFQVYVDNNSTSQGKSVHGDSSKVFDYKRDIVDKNVNPVPNPIVITPTIGRADSFLQVRADSSTTVSIDSIEISYLGAQDPGDQEPTPTTTPTPTPEPTATPTPAPVEEPSAPNTPTGLTATGKDGSVELKWTTVTEATYYNVKMSETLEGPFVFNTSSSVNSATVNGLANDTVYYFTVSAVNDHGESADSAPVSATPTSNQFSGMINIISDWKGSVFGDIGGTPSKTNFEITENLDSTVTMKVAGNKGKIAGTSEGLAYYYKEVPSDASFELTAKVKVVSFDANNQVAFGIMLRSDILENTSVSSYGDGDYAAVGAVDKSMKAYSRLKGKSVEKSTYIFTDANAPAPNEIYDLSVRKYGSDLIVRINDDVKLIKDYQGTVNFAGLFAVRNTTVTYSDVNLNINPNLGVWTFGAHGSNTSDSANPPPTIDSNGVTIEATGGKIDGSNEGISYYYKLMPKDSNGEIKAKATVKSFNSNSKITTPNQKTFGLMLKDKFVGSAYSNFIAVGALDTVMKGFYRFEVDGDKAVKKLPAFTGIDAPTTDRVYDLKIKKSGEAYELSVNGVTDKVVPGNLFSDQIYAGLFVARDAEVTFSNFSAFADDRKPVSLTLDSSAMRTEYFVSDPLELDSLKVKAKYAGGKEEILTTSEYIVTGYDSSVVGPRTLTVHFNGQTANVDVNINPLVVTKFEVKFTPSKTTYYPGDTLNPEGMVVEAEYNHGKAYATLGHDQIGQKYSIAIEGAANTEDFSLNSLGTVKVLVTSLETPLMSTTFDVVVKNTELVDVEIRKAPFKTAYYLGEDLDLSGLLVYAKYRDSSEVRLEHGDYVVSELDTSIAGNKTLQVSFRGKSANLIISVRQKKPSHIEVTKYPKTTYSIGEQFDSMGIEVSKVYDNKDRDIIPADQYSIDTSKLDATKAGVYDLTISSPSSGLPPVVLKVTVREPVVYKWNSIRFGQSISKERNIFEDLGGGKYRLTALEGGGKITGDHDGITFYYTEIDALKDNFELSANIKVEAFAKPSYDAQESFGIMARDAIGKDLDSSPFYSNMAAIGGYAKGTIWPLGTQLIIRTGVEAPDGTGGKGVKSLMLKEERPTTDNTYPVKDYRLTLAKTNSGYVGKLNNDIEDIHFEPNINVQDGKLYVGFYAARLATIEVSDIQFTVTAAKTDAPAVPAPPRMQLVMYDMFYSEQTSRVNYNFNVLPSVSGLLTVKQGENVVIQDRLMSPGKQNEVWLSLTPDSKTNITVTYEPDKNLLLDSYDKIIRSFTVTHKDIDHDIIVSTTGTSDGLGTAESPMDLDSAVNFVKPGRKVIVQDGVYKRNTELNIMKHNNGTPTAMKYLEAAPGAKPVIDFNKVGEGAILSGNYWHIKGLDFARTAGNSKGFTIGGSYNIVENSRFYENGDTGLQISRTDGSSNITEWPSYNLILNSVSFDNRDPSDNNADGFAAKLTSGYGNIFRGTISHNNIDDGWDLYTKTGSGAIGPVLIEDSIAYNNGTLTNGTVGKGDKNGFKLGGEGIHVPHIIRNSIAFGNGAYGFTSNSNPGVIAENNIGFNNDRGNLSFTSYEGIPTNFKIDGFISYHKGLTAKDNYPASLSSDTNFFFGEAGSVNKSGVKLSDANFKPGALTVPTSIERDVNGKAVLGDFLSFIMMGKPTGLKATGGDGYISLDWNAVPGATSYHVYRSHSVNGTYTKIATASASEYKDNGLSGGSRFVYSVSAVNANGETDRSDVASGQSDSPATGGGTAGGPTGGSPAAQPTDSGVNVAPTIAKEKDANGKETAKAVIDSLSSALDALKGSSGKKISVDMGSGDAAQVQVPAGQLTAAAKDDANIVLSVKHNDVTYDLPAKVLANANLASLLGTDENNVKINISITTVSGQAADDLNAKAKASGITLLSTPIEFSITAEGNGKSVELNDFGTTYVPRTVVLAKTVDSNNTTAVLYDPESGEMTFVPAVFEVVDGKTQVKIMRPGNSIYTVVNSSKSFADLNGHWSKKDVELLASKLVVNGMTDTTFAPDNRITRAEFAALLTRSLGLTAGTTVQFKDVSSQSWYAKSVSAAVKAGLVEGFEDGTFRPNDSITREQMAVMIARALKVAGKNVAADDSQLSKFADKGSLSSWAKDAVAQAGKVGIINGTTDTTFEPSAFASRAEAAVMLKRLLQHAEFMN
jgi:pectate disaccharide-lyase